MIEFWKNEELINLILVCNTSNDQFNTNIDK